MVRNPQCKTDFNSEQSLTGGHSRTHRETSCVSRRDVFDYADTVQDLEDKE